jgi:hypothetical protein
MMNSPFVIEQAKKLAAAAERARKPPARVASCIARARSRAAKEETDSR